MKEKKSITTTIFWWVVAPIICVLAIWGYINSLNLTAPMDGYKVGAYYYSWYPRNFDRQGYLRKRMIPRQFPALGEYNSLDPLIAERHIKWASQNGIDYFAISYWPRRPEQNKAINEGFLKAKNIGDIKFCMFFESQQLNFQYKAGLIDFNNDTNARLVEYLEVMAKKYFSHPSYLKVNGRPVVIMYLSRNYVGDYANGFAQAREALKKMGWDLFLIGDEVYWDVMKDDTRMLTNEPQKGRVQLFDMVTAYNIYKSENSSQAGYASKSGFIPDLQKLYEQYIKAGGEKTKLMPNVMPGYNDRGVRRQVDHYVIPRQWEKGGAEGSLLAEMFERVAFPFLDPKLNMIMITSWNEWNEDTAIEPMKKSVSTTVDNSATGKNIGKGYAYSGYGETYLQVVRNKVVAVSGRVTKDDEGLADFLVCGFDMGKTPVMCDRTDSTGYYKLSRLHMKPGAYYVGVVVVDSRQTVIVTPAETVVDVNFEF